MRVFIHLLKAWWRCDVLGKHRPVTYVDYCDCGDRECPSSGLKVRCGDCQKWGT